MHDRTTVTIQNDAQVIEGSTEVDVGNINLPMLMRLRRLLEAGPLTRRLAFPPGQQASLLQQPPNARRTNRHHPSIQHHEGQPPKTLQRVF